MTTLKTLTIGAMVLFYLNSCSNKTESTTIILPTNAIDTLNIGCLESFDINPSDNKEKINQVYGKDHIKQGHWIIFGISKGANEKVNRIKLQEGYYRNNKKNGYWKSYKEDGTVKDSIEFINGNSLISQSKHSAR